jgi:hypothetical protein
VTIAGRTFTLGAVYVARDPRSRAVGRRPRRLVGHDPAHPWPGGRVEVELVSSGAAGEPRSQRRWLSGRGWAKWAGERIGP